MSIGKIVKTWRSHVLIGFMAMVVPGMVAADMFVPYPGKREATLIRIEAPDFIYVFFNTDATGFFRTLGIHLPGIVIARDRPNADQCERQAAQRALAFTEAYLTNAKEMYVHDIRMENSADEEAIAYISTDKGRLSAALIKEGLARPDSIDPDTPWCK